MDKPIPRIAVYILAGGRSSRFGSDKARAKLDGEALIVRLARAVRPYAAQVKAVAGTAGAYEDLGLATIADVHPGRGPLSGLHAALHDRPAGPWLLLLSCDLAHLSPAWVSTLLAHAGQDVEAVAFRGEYWQPMPGLYRTTLLDQVAARLAGDEPSMQALLGAVRAKAVALPADWPAVAQINTPDDLARVRADQG